MYKTRFMIWMAMPGVLFGLLLITAASYAAEINLTNLQPITLSNALDLQLLGRYGEGRFQNSIAVSSDGSMVAIAAAGGALIVDAQSGERETFIPSPSAVESLTFSPDGETLAFTYRVKSDEKYKVELIKWMTEDYILKPVLAFAMLPDGGAAHEIPLSGRGCGEYRALELTYSDDGRRLYFHDWFSLKGYESIDNVCVLNSADGELLDILAPPISVSALSVETRDNVEKILAARENTYDSYEISPDGKTLVVGNQDGSLAIYSVPDGEQIHGWIPVIQDHPENPVRALAIKYSPNGEVLYVVFGNYFVDTHTTVVAFEVDGWRELFTVSDRTTIDRLPSVSQDGGLLSFGGYRDGTVWLYLLRGSMRSFMLKGHPEDVITEEFSSDGRRLATGSIDGTICIWDTETGALIRTFGRHMGQTWKVAYLSDDETLISVDEDGFLRKWDTETGALLSEFMIGTSECEVRALIPVWDGTAAIVASGCEYPLYCKGGGKGDLRRIDLINGGITVISSDAVFNFSLTSDGKRYAKYGMPNGVEFGSLNNDDTMMTVSAFVSPFGTGGLSGAATSGDGSAVFSGNAFGLHVFNPENGTLTGIAAENVLPTMYGNLKIAADGKILLMAGADGTVSLWGVPSR